MDFDFTEGEKAQRSEYREFAISELPSWWKPWEPAKAYPTDEYWPIARDMSRKLAARGWLTMSWPEEYGGRGASHMERLVYREEMAYQMVPGLDSGVGGICWIGPSLMLFGTDEQKRRHLPGIASGDVYWCTGYSEPDAGSDLASMKCRATRSGDDYVINGQKVWTSAAHRCDWCWLAVRTDPEAPKHKGISILLLDLKTPGVTVNPLINLGGYPGFCEIFFDNARVPVDRLVGEENEGWRYIVRALGFERTDGIELLSRARRLLSTAVDYARDTKRNGEPLSRSPVVRHRLAELTIECQVGRLMCYRIAWMEDRGLAPDSEASMVKNLGAELGQRVSNAAMQMMGLYGQLDSGAWAPIQGSIGHSYVDTVADTIAAGTSVINRNVIAIRGLGLPR